MIRELQVIAGTLNFLCRAIVLGHTFIRRMYNAMMVTNVKTGEPLKPYHHIKVNEQLKEDCKVWKEFISVQPGRMGICRPFVDLNQFETSETLNFYTDSSANGDLGFGGIFNDRWLFGCWEPGFVATQYPSIKFLELAALCIVVITWGRFLTNTRIIIFCDNQAVMHMVNNQTS